MYLRGLTQSTYCATLTKRTTKRNWEVGAMWAKTRSHERDHSSAVLLPAPETAPFICNETRSLGRAIFMSAILERDTPKHDCFTRRAAFLEHLCTQFNTAMLLVRGNLNTLMKAHIHLQNSSPKIIVPYLLSVNRELCQSTLVQYNTKKISLPQCLSAICIEGKLNRSPEGKSLPETKGGEGRRHQGE